MNISQSASPPHGIHPPDRADHLSSVNDRTGRRVFSTGCTRLGAVLICVLLSWGSLVLSASSACGQNWLAEPSYFTHDRATGQRVNQYYQRTSVIHTPSPYRSVYRHTRSSLQVGDSVDQYHSVERYGEPVRPYGEWRFPYRPFSVPYPQWGPIYPGGGFGFPFVPTPYGGGGGGGNWGPYGPSGVINGAGFPPPWNDGSYPDVRRTQLPPQPFPSPTIDQSINNDVTGDDNVIQNQ